MNKHSEWDLLDNQQKNSQQISRPSHTYWQDAWRMLRKNVLAMGGQQQQQISDPYTDFEIEFQKCSNIIQNKILNDDEFKFSMNECDKQIQHMVEQIVRPQVLQTKEGRISFEKLLATFRNIRDRASVEETQNLEKIQQLMQDDVIQKRLMELSGNINTEGAK